jgi:hypothetical protein
MFSTYIHTNDTGNVTKQTSHRTQKKNRTTQKMHRATQKGLLATAHSSKHPLLASILYKSVCQMKGDLSLDGITLMH